MISKWLAVVSLFICRVPVCKFAYWNLSVTPKSGCVVLVQLWWTHTHTMWWKFWGTGHTFPVKVEQEDALPSCFRSQIVNTVSFSSLFSTMFFKILYLGDFSLKWPPSIVLSTVLSTWGRLLSALTEEIHVR